MKTIVEKPTKTILFGAALATAALVIILLAASFASGPARAQSPNNDYPTPLPCGPDDDPAAGTASMEEPHEVTEGHFALFEAYWRNTGSVNTVGNSFNTGVLHTNECPPEVATTRTDDGFGNVTVTTTRSARNDGMDIEEAIMHVLDAHMATTVATNAEVTDGQLSLEEYPDVEKFAPAGSQVWWLKLDDPDTAKDDKSNLSLGFSTLLLDDKYWLTGDDGNPMRYKFLVERYPGDPSKPREVPHFLTYEAPKAGNAEATLVWDSTRPAVAQTDVQMNPGEFRDLQWVFTKPGTYLLWVALQGHVRRDNPNKPSDVDYDPDWKAISTSSVAETSEVKRYTIQVGTPLDEIEPPIFGVNLMVEENSPGGVKVGDPIPVYNADAGILTYKLSGEGSEDFALDTSTDPHIVQVVVADGASLDYETMPTYDLTLSVTDGVDHEDNYDPAVDDILLVRIDLKDQAPGMNLRVDQIFPAVGETVNFIARYEPTPELRDQEFDYLWAEQVWTGDGIRWHPISGAPDAPTWSVSQSSRMSVTYRVSAQWDHDDDPATPIESVNSNDIMVTWN